MIIADTVLSLAATPQAAYNGLQVLLMRQYIARGGSPEHWCACVAPAFRRRYGWILTDGQATGQARTLPSLVSRTVRRLP